MVNRIWRHHFGRGLVDTPNDFGELGDRPTHQDLLNWLASEFMDSGWSVKHIHRLILNSATWQQSSVASAQSLALDAEGVWYSRQMLRRLDAEEVRDGMLHTAGILNNKMGGPSFFSPMPPRVLATASTPETTWGRSSESETLRRSLYIKVKRSLLPPMLVAFDLADSDLTCPARFKTTQPSQALALLNGSFAHTHARAFAARLEREAPNNRSAQIRLGIFLTTCRQPSEEEVKEDLHFIESLTRTLEGDSQRAMALYALTLWNTNAFLDVP
jgi:hypothetical protein